MTGQRGAAVRAEGLHAVVPGSNPGLASCMDLFPVVADSTPPRFVNSQLVASCPLGFLNHVSVKFELFLSHC